MSWWDFEEGKKYNRDYVVSRIRSHIKSSGKVKNEEQKLGLLNRLRSVGMQTWYIRPVRNVGVFHR